MNEIAWHEFSWEAFATIFTGLAAVGAAVWVGSKQKQILDKQVNISERQITLEELKLKSALFEVVCSLKSGPCIELVLASTKGARTWPVKNIPLKRLYRI